MPSNILGGGIKMKTGKIEQFKKLSQFQSLKDFNNHVEQHLLELKAELTKSERIAIKVIIRHAAKVYGVANASLKKFVIASQKYDGVGVSRSTFKRAIKKAISHGLFVVYETERDNGSQSTNVYVFNRIEIVSFSSSNEPRPENRKVEQSPVEQQKEVEQLNLLKTDKQTKTNKIIDIRKDNAIKDIPLDYQDWLKTYGYTGKQIVEFYKCLRYTTKYLTFYNEQEKVQLGIRAFKQMVINKKLGYKVRNMFGYYTQVLNNFLDMDYLELVREG